MACNITQATICRKRGNTQPFLIFITEDGLFDENTGLPVNPIDITGFSYALAVDPSESPPDATQNLFELSTPASGLEVTDGPNGEITVTLSPVDADQTPGDYFYDLEQTDLGGFIDTVLEGGWQFSQDITK